MTFTLAFHDILPMKRSLTDSLHCSQTSHYMSPMKRTRALSKENDQPSSPLKSSSSSSSSVVIHGEAATLQPADPTNLSYFLSLELPSNEQTNETPKQQQQQPLLCSHAGFSACLQQEEEEEAESGCLHTDIDSFLDTWDEEVGAQVFNPGDSFMHTSFTDASETVCSDTCGLANWFASDLECNGRSLWEDMLDLPSSTVDRINLPLDMDASLSQLLESTPGV